MPLSKKMLMAMVSKWKQVVTPSENCWKNKLIRRYPFFPWSFLCYNSLKKGIILFLVTFFILLAVSKQHYGRHPQSFGIIIVIVMSFWCNILCPLPRLRNIHVEYSWCISLQAIYFHIGVYYYKEKNDMFYVVILMDSQFVFC